MSLLSRVIGAVIAAGALLSIGLIAPPAATAEPVVINQDFALHFRSDETRCVLEPSTFEWSGSNCPMNGNFDGGHPWTPSGTAPDFLNLRGGVYYYRTGSGEQTTIDFRADNGAYISGTIPSRGSDQFTITRFYSPRMPLVDAVGQTVKLNVVMNKYWYAPNGYYDFYLAGDLPLREPDCPPRPFPSPLPLPCSTGPTGPWFGSS